MIQPLQPRRPIHAIPTAYRGVQFRSRTEARWAAFFDVVGWSWNYEPPEFPGWIPELKITTTGNPLLVEVKGADTFDAPETQEAARDIERCLYGQPFAALICGSQPFTVDGMTYVGWTPQDYDGAFSWDRAAVGMIAGDQLCVCHSSLSFRCHICGADDGWCATMDPKMLDECWSKACNLTQWRPKV